MISYSRRSVTTDHSSMPEADYQNLIDGPTWAFIRETDRWYPPEAVGLTIAEQRDVYNRMCAAFRKPHPAGITVRDESLGGVMCRIYEPTQAAQTAMYFHGGGFVVGGLDSHDDVCAELCAATGLRIVSADYRLAPEHRHPAAYEDCLSASRAVLDRWPGPLIMAGDSAGGSLAASVTHALRGTGRINGQVLIYPSLGGDRSTGSYLTHAHAPMLTLADVEFYLTIRHPGPPPEHDPTAAALQDNDFTGLPPSVIFAAECDPLADDGREYRDRVLAAGGRAASIVDTGLVHGWLRARHSVPRAAESFARIAATLRALSTGVWPFGDRA
ncbi:alpha/beta hydrolase [Gemmobacter denitrificans]|uniref:Alpha/beta hydrolase n=1 Tax=Gemmobacter denitrificans TaxID=3123040 RepID=A0ABU8BZB6_9RHOB